jgi:hypothetical protein
MLHIFVSHAQIPPLVPPLVFPWGPIPRRHSSEDDEDEEEEAQEAAEEDDEEDEEQDDVRIRDAVGSFSELDHGMQGAKSDVRDRFMSCGDDEDGSFGRRSADQMSNPPIAVTVNYKIQFLLLLLSPPFRISAHFLIPFD